MRSISWTILFLLLGGCAATAPNELAQARTVYQRASQGPAARYAPAHLNQARIALQEAEDAFAAIPYHEVVRQLGYLATRKAETAEVLGLAEQHRIQKERAEAWLVAARPGPQTRIELHPAPGASAAAIQRERAARVLAEARAAEAMERLTEVGEVRQEPRGTVITIPGGVLFAFDEAELLPGARQRLDRVAAALGQNPSAAVVVEGHTDSIGADRYNQALSFHRAEAVRSYLAQRGVEPRRLRVVGFGEEQPRADNATEQGRAMNRRVEIVVERKAATR